MQVLPQPNLIRFDRSVRFATLKRTIIIKINPYAGVAQPGQRRKVEGLVS